MGQQSNKPETFSNVTPIGQQETFSNVTPIGEEQPGWLDKEIPLDSYAHATESGLQSVGRGVRGAISGAWNTIKTAADAWNNPKADVGDTILPDPHLEQVPAAISDINKSPDPVGTYAKVGQETAGQGAGAALTALATEGAGRVAPKIPAGRIAQTFGKAAKGVAEDVPVVRQVAKLGKYWNSTAPKPDYPGAPLPEAPPAELTQASALFRGAKPGVDPSAGLGNIPRGSIAAKFKDPGAPLPTAPEPQLTQGTSLLYGARAGQDSAAGLGTIPVKRELPAAFQPLPPKATPPIGTADNPFKSGQIAEAMKPPAAQTPAPPFQRGQLGKMLDEQLSKATNAAPPLNPKEPIYKRGSIAQQVKSAPSEDLTPVLQKSLDQVNAAKDLPEGHTPLTSRAMKSYKYDPAAREFHARMTSGDTTYVYGDVSPEDAQAFEAAESKGKALPQIKRNPLVAKIVNGKRVAVKPVSQ